MLIKLTEVDGKWNLWATADGAADASPVAAAWGRSHAQILTLLTGILTDPVPELEQPIPAATERDETPTTNRKNGSVAALASMLTTLDDWIESARDNHEALEHRGEASACWQQFHPADIRAMVNDAARAMGIAEFPHPARPVEMRLK